MTLFALLAIAASLAALGTEPALNGWTLLAIAGAVAYLIALVCHERMDDTTNEEDLS